MGSCSSRCQHGKWFGQRGWLHFTSTLPALLSSGTLRRTQLTCPFGSAYVRACVCVFLLLEKITRALTAPEVAVIYHPHLNPARATLSHASSSPPDGHLDSGIPCRTCTRTPTEGLLAQSDCLDSRMDDTHPEHTSIAFVPRYAFARFLRCRRNAAWHFTFSHSPKTLCTHDRCLLSSAYNSK